MVTYPHDVPVLGTLITLRNEEKATLAPDVLMQAIKIYKNVYVFVPAIGGYVKAVKADVLWALKSHNKSGPTFVHLDRLSDVTVHDLYID